MDRRSRSADPDDAVEAGQTVEYTRTVFVPVYPYVGERHIRIGLYSTSASQRLRSDGEDVGQRAYKVATLKLLPQTENMFIVSRRLASGRRSAQNPAIEWQWTKKEATLAFKNPKKDATFYLEYDARPDCSQSRSRSR